MNLKILIENYLSFYCRGSLSYFYYNPKRIFSSGDKILSLSEPKKLADIFMHILENTNLFVLRQGIIWKNRDKVKVLSLFFFFSMIKSSRMFAHKTANR